MPETAENVAEKYQINREDQDKMALSSQQKAAKSIANGRLSKEIISVEIPQRKGDPIIFDKDEHPRGKIELTFISIFCTFSIISEYINIYS